MPDAAGNIKGIALGGKAGEAWERIFGRGAFRAVVEAEMRGLSAQIEAEDRRLLSGHYGNPMDVAYLPCDCEPGDCPCCCRCGLED